MIDKVFKAASIFKKLSQNNDAKYVRFLLGCFDIPHTPKTTKILSELTDESIEYALQKIRQKIVEIREESKKEVGMDIKPEPQPQESFNDMIEGWKYK